MRKASFWIVATTLTSFASVAAAADLPVSVPAKAAPARVVADNWTGFYVGVNGGYAWGRTTGTLNDPDPGNFSISGGLAGGQVGANYQFSNVVVGVEADYQWADIKGSAITTTLATPITTNAKVQRFGTVRGRLGWAFDRWLVYGTGGWAFDARSKVSASTGGVTLISDSQTLSGWTAGGGVEWAFAPSWSAKVEYLHINLNQRTFFPTTAFCAGTPSLCQGGAHIDLVRAGLNYRFGGGWY